jgi:hypothetical protein
VADAVDAAELLDVDVDEFAGVGAFIAAHRLGRLEALELVRRLTVAGETPTWAAICWPVQRCRLSSQMRSTVGCGVGRYSRCGREERSCSPATPSAL